MLKTTLEEAQVLGVKKEIQGKLQVQEAKFQQKNAIAQARQAAESDLEKSVSNIMQLGIRSGIECKSLWGTMNNSDNIPFIALEDISRIGKLSETQSSPGQNLPANVPSPISSFSESLSEQNSTGMRLIFTSPQPSLHRREL